MKRKTGKHLLLLLFLLPLLILLQNFYSAKKPGPPCLKPDTCFTESFREQALSSALYAELEERVHSDGEFADLLTTTMLNGKFFPKYLSGNREAYLRFKPPKPIMTEKLLSGCLERPGKFSHSNQKR